MISPSRADSSSRLVSCWGSPPSPVSCRPSAWARLTSSSISWSSSRDALQRLFPRSGHPLGMQLFSAKESVSKAWFPLTGRWLDFDQCAITPDPDRGTFTAVLKVPGPVVGGVRLDRLDGRLRVRRRLVVTAVVIPAPTSERAG
ncbi:4'-phosphopantetheinyl transferase superfamily protein [Streptomyces sp. NPDC003697]